MSKEWTNAQLARITSDTLGLDCDEKLLFDAVIDSGFDITRYRDLTADDVMPYYADINRFVDSYADTIDLVCSVQAYTYDVETMQDLRCAYWNAAFYWALFQVEYYVENNDPPAECLDLGSSLKG